MKIDKLTEQILKITNNSDYGWIHSDSVDAERIRVVLSKELSLDAVMCGSCKHWQNNGRGNIGKCMVSKIRHPMMHSGCGLYTHEDFGCKLFQSRPQRTGI